MAKQINPVKQTLLERNFLTHPELSLKENVMKAGYSAYTAANASRLTSVKLCLEKLEAQFKLSEVTVEMVVKQLQSTRQLAIEKGDLSTAAFCSTQLGRYLAMFTDRQRVDQVNINIEDTHLISKYIQDNNL